MHKAPLFFMVLLPVAAQCADGDLAASRSSCPGATAWIEAHRDQLPAGAEMRDEARVFSDPALRKQLLQRFEADQNLRKQYLVAPNDATIIRRLEVMDGENLGWLRSLIRNYGVPTVEQVGERGVEWAWLLVQHADQDPRFQASLLPIFIKRYEAGQLAGDYVAKMTDRVLIARNQKQQFGTQFDWLAGRFKLRNHIEVTEINVNRRRLGLMPLEDYACFMQTKLQKAEVSGSP